MSSVLAQRYSSYCLGVPNRPTSLYIISAFLPKTKTKQTKQKQTNKKKQQQNKTKNKKITQKTKYKSIHHHNTNKCI